MKIKNVILVVLFSFTVPTATFAQIPLPEFKTKVKVVKETKEAKELKSLTEQYQKTPNDLALRDQIIKLAVKVKPNVPEEATRAFEKATALQSDAKDTAAFELSIAAYKEAISIAPWWGDAYFNLALTLDSAQRYDEAIAALKTYQLTINTESSEIRDVQNKIYAIEAKIEKSAGSKKDTQIIAGQSIGGLTIGMLSEKLRPLLGEPSKSENVGPWWQHLWWKQTGLMTTIKMSLNKLDAVQISGPATQYKTSEGIAVGTSENTIQPKLGDADRSGKQKSDGKKVYCYRSGLKITATEGKVSAIEVFRPQGFDETYCESRLIE